MISKSEGRRPRRLAALALFTLGEALLVSLDPAVAVLPATGAFLLGSLALTPPVPRET